MEKYKAKSIEELAETLNTLSKGQHTAGLSPELRDLLCMLKAHKLRHTNDAHAFCKNGCIETLLELLQCCDASSGDVVVILGVIESLSALHPAARTTVVNKGLESIVGYLQSASTSDVIGSTARVFANLGIDRPHVSALHKHAVVSQLSQLLDQPETDLDCKRMIIRALRMLCRVQECLEELKQSDGMPLILDCLKSDHVELAMGALHVLEVVSAGGDPDILQCLCNKEVMQYVIRYCNHSKNKVRRRGINILLNVAKVLDGRIALSSAGGVETLVAFMESSDKQSDIFREVVCALCTCCRDVLSRQRLRDCGGLERLIALLRDPSHASLHRNIVVALVCYYFDENTLKLMVMKMGLQQSLTYHLKTMISKDEDTVATSEPGLESSSETCEAMETTLSHTESLKPSVSRDSPPPSKRPCLEGASEIVKHQKPPTSTTCDDPPPSKRPCLDLGLEAKIADQKSAMSCDGPCTDKSAQDVDSDASSSTPHSFLDSLLSSPNPYQSTSSVGSRPPDSPLVGDVNSTFESQVILLVSRISHMKECLVIQSYSDTLLTILDYFIASRPPNLHISKVLTRVFMNLHCFQNIISSLVPSRIHRILRERLPSPTSSPAQVESDFLGLCQGLVEHLSKNAESPYGQGVLAHLLLRGTDKEKQASCLAVPLLCRSARVCQKLMVEYGAFQILCQLLKDTNKEEVWEMGVESMLALGHTMQLKPVPRHRRRYSTLPPELEAQAKRFPFTRLDSSFKDLSLYEATAPSECCNEANSDPSTHCRYIDTDHRPFDLTIVLHSPARQQLQVQVHKAKLMEESDVFRVMLAGSYKESLCTEVHIHSVALRGFLSLLHHIYGCGWECGAMLDKVYRRPDDDEEEEGSNIIVSSQSDVVSESSDILLEAVTSACKSKEDAHKVQHCLQVLACAGRFLLPDLITLSEHAAVKYLSPDNLVPMFHFAQFHQCFCLAESCMRALLGLPHTRLRTDLFKELLTSGEGEAAIHIILLFLTAVSLA